MVLKYVAIIDAGSTSSRLIIYSWQAVAPANRYKIPVKFTKIFSEESKGPIRVNQTAGAIKDDLHGLLKTGAEALHRQTMIGDPEDTVGKVPLYVMATAGMRDAAGTPAEGAQETMHRAWDVIHELRRDERCCAGCKIYDDGASLEATNADVSDDTKTKHSFVLLQNQEGIFAWVALNHGRYQPDQMPGVLELGGKSLQLAYADPNDGDLGPVCLLKSRHMLTTRSWVLGAEESRYAALEKKLIDGATGAGDIYNPCLPHHQPARIYSDSSRKDEHNSIGSGDFAKCLAFAQSYLNQNAGNLTTPLPPLDIEPFTKRFYGIAGFWYTYEFFSKGGIYDRKSAYDPHLFRKAVDQYCNGSWLKPFAWNEDGVRDNKHIDKQCFAAAWMITLFHGRKGFQLRLSNQEAWNGLIRFPSKSDLADRSSWTVGAATMVAGNDHPSKYCSDDESGGSYPPRVGAHLVEPPYNRTKIFSIPSSPAVMSSTPVVAPPPPSNFVIESAQPVRAPSTPSAISGSLLPSLPFNVLNPSSTFSEGLICGVLLIALVLAAYRRFSSCRVAVQVPISDEKQTVDVDEQPIMVRACRIFFDKTKGTIFLAGEDNISSV